MNAIIQRLFTKSLEIPMRILLRHLEPGDALTLTAHSGCKACGCRLVRWGKVEGLGVETVAMLLAERKH